MDQNNTMGNLALYLATILIWGTSFYAIRLQLTDVEPEVSILFRFSIASTILIVYCLLGKRNMRYPLKVHLRFILMGFFLFFLNFFLIYLATRHLPTGLVSVVFSSVVIFNMINGAIFLKDRLSPLMIAGALTGITGIVFIFLPEIATFDYQDQSLASFVLALVATISASTGMLLSSKNQRDNLPVMQSNAWGMFYGAVIMLLYIGISGIPITIDLSVSYLGSLFYLALFASVLAFGFFLTLVGRIGAGNASYASVLFPILALALSTWLEGYQWTTLAVLGVVLTISGNVLILIDKQK